MNRFFRFFYTSLFGIRPIHNLSSRPIFNSNCGDIRNLKSIPRFQRYETIFDYEYLREFEVKIGTTARKLVQGTYADGFMEKIEEKTSLTWPFKSKNANAWKNNRRFKIVVPILVTYGGFLQLNIING